MLVRRKLIKEILVQASVIFLVLLLIVSINQITHLLKLVAFGSITLSSLATMMGLQLIDFLSFIVPPSVFLGILLVLSRWYLDHEMTVLSVSGVSHRRIYGMIMGFSLLVSILIALFMFECLPSIETYQVQNAQNAFQQLSVKKIRPGEFTALSNRSAIYASKSSLIHPKVNRVMAFFPQSSKGSGINSWRVLTAKTLDQESLPHYNNHSYFVFHHGYSTIASTENANWQQASFDLLGYSVPGAHPAKSGWPTNLRWSELWGASFYNAKAASILMWRLSVPVSILILSFWACLLGYVKPRQGKVAKLLPALLLYGFYIYLLSWSKGNIKDGVWSLWGSFFIIHGMALLVGFLLVFLRYGRRAFVGFKSGSAS
jgi:lipopolysaccharide export system permease protein